MVVVLLPNGILDCVPAPIWGCTCLGEGDGLLVVLWGCGFILEAVMLPEQTSQNKYVLPLSSLSKVNVVPTAPTVSVMPLKQQPDSWL